MKCISECIRNVFYNLASSKHDFNLSFCSFSDGAALVYVSVKISKNCEVLFKYLVHRIYGLQFKTPALVVEKDAVFIPTGWDNEKKIAILYENIQSFSPDDDFNDIITVPVNTNVSDIVVYI